VGIEAISGGADHVWFTEKSESALASIRTNLKTLKIMRGYTVEERGTGALLERLAKAAKKASESDGAEPARPGTLLDLVYLDPPWEAEAEYASTLHLLGSARGQAILAPGALIVAEHSSKSPLAERYGELTQTRTLKQGDAALSFYAVTTAAAE
jgi:16S rRNA G966 N2-methylase RsmD